MLDLLRRKAPNAALLAFLIVPVISLAVLALGATGGLKAGAGVGAFITLLFCVPAAGLVAARIRWTPLLVSAGLVVMEVVGSIAIVIACRLHPDYAPPYSEPSCASMLQLSIFPIAAVVLTWLRADCFDRPLAPSRFKEWALEGLRGITKEDEGALRRGLAGAAMVAVGFAVLFVPLALRMDLSQGLPYLLVWAVRVFLIGGCLTLASAVHVHDVD